MEDVGKGAESNDPKTKDGTAYDFGYQTGLKSGREHVRLYNGMNASGKAQFRTTYLNIASRCEEEYRSVAQSYGENHPATQQKKGIAEGYMKALEDGGIR